LDIHIPHGPDSLSWNIEGFGDVSLDGYYICYALHILYSYSRGVMYYKNGEYDKASADYTEAIRLKRDEAGFYLNRGMTYSAKCKQDKAIADYTEAVEREPDNPEYYDCRASTYDDAEKLRGRP